jgi:hypothetical protein
MLNVSLGPEDPVNPETLNGHAMLSLGSEEVKVDIESPEMPSEKKTEELENSEDKAGILECFEHVCLQAGQS